MKIRDVGLSNCILLHWAYGSLAAVADCYVDLLLEPLISFIAKCSYQSGKVGASRSLSRVWDKQALCLAFGVSNDDY